MKNLLQIKLFALIIFILFLNSHLFSQLSGTYTIGSGGNYATISAAVSSLVSNGVSGPVIFNIRTGNYNEQITIDSISGVNSINTVTFQSESGNAPDVNIYNKTMISDYTINFFRAAFITLKNITFIDSMKVNYRSIVRISSNSNNISLINNVFVNKMSLQFEASTAFSIFGSGNYIIIRGNTFSGTGFGAEKTREAVNLSAGFGGCEISNNTYSGFNKVITLENIDFAVIEKNDISGPGNYTQQGTHCLTLNNCNGSRILKNKLDGHYSCGPSSIAGSLLLMNNSSNFLIANNFFKFAGCTAIEITSCNDSKFIYNTIGIGQADNPTNIRVGNCDSISLINNIYVNSSNFRYRVILEFSGSLFHSNYNSFFNRAPVFAFYNGVNTTNLAAWRSVTGEDYDSRFRNPEFVSFSDFHLTGSSLTDDSLKGIPLAEITDDIDGNLRDPLFPTMGADEPPKITLSLTMLIEGFYNGGTNSQVADNVKTYLRSTVSPYTVEDSAVASISANGTGTAQFNNASNGTYYIVVDHRNSIETWSKAGGEIFDSATASYNFTSSVSQAFGNNLKLKGTRYCVYSGDVNKDGVIDGTDTQLIDNAAYNFVSGYVSTDVDGNNFVDGSDAIIVDNNVFNFVSLIRP